MADDEVQALKEITLVTDGACIVNPGPGGWACILRYGSHATEKAGGDADTTNNRMELQAAIEGLKALREPCAVTLISDSRYLLDGIATWRHGWRRGGWVRRKKGKEEPVPNSDLWQVLDELAGVHTISCKWVRGHTGEPDNERCDALAMEQAEKQELALRDSLPCWTRFDSSKPHR
jgi:ribonuclease HI